MSVSAHLTPEPERRLWLILESMRKAVDDADLRIGALTALAAAELACLHASGRPLTPASAPLAAALLAGVGSLVPLERLPRSISFLDYAGKKPRADDNLVLPEDLVKYSHGDLIFRYDKYLGGGITATPYYEDLVGRILENARLAARKQRLLKLVCLSAAAGQLSFLWLLR